MGRLGGDRLPHPEPGDRGRGVHDQRGTVRRIDEYSGDDRGNLCDYRTDSDDSTALHHGGKSDLGVFWRDPAHADYYFVCLLITLVSLVSMTERAGAMIDAVMQYASGNSLSDEYILREKHMRTRNRNGAQKDLSCRWMLAKGLSGIRY